MNIDFPNVDISGGTELKPEGIYRVRLDRHEPCKASTGTEQIRWFGKIVDGDHKGQSLVEHTALTEAASWRIASFLHHAGIDVKKLPKLEVSSEGFKKVLKAADGKEMYWYVVQSTYNGKLNNKVTEYKKIDEDEDGEVIDLEDIPDFLK